MIVDALFQGLEQSGFAVESAARDEAYPFRNAHAPDRSGVGRVQGRGQGWGRNKGQGPGRPGQGSVHIAPCPGQDGPVGHKGHQLFPLQLVAQGLLGPPRSPHGPVGRLLIRPGPGQGARYQVGQVAAQDLRGPAAHDPPAPGRQGNPETDLHPSPVDDYRRAFQDLSGWAGKRRSPGRAGRWPGKRPDSENRPGPSGGPVRPIGLRGNRRRRRARQSSSWRGEQRGRPGHGRYSVQSRERSSGPGCPGRPCSPGRPGDEAGWSGRRRCGAWF